jgi:hypothetical protein
VFIVCVVSNQIIIQVDTTGKPPVDVLMVNVRVPHEQIVLFNAGEVIPG